MSQLPHFNAEGNLVTEGTHDTREVMAPPRERHQGGRVLHLGTYELASPGQHFNLIAPAPFPFAQSGTDGYGSFAMEGQEPLNPSAYETGGGVHPNMLVATGESIRSVQMDNARMRQMIPTAQNGYNIPSSTAPLSHLQDVSERAEQVAQQQRRMIDDRLSAEAQAVVDPALLAPVPSSQIATPGVAAGNNAPPPGVPAGINAPPLGVPVGNNAPPHFGDQMQYQIVAMQMQITAMQQQMQLMMGQQQQRQPFFNHQRITIENGPDWNVLEPFDHAIPGHGGYPPAQLQPPAPTGHLYEPIVPTIGMHGLAHDIRSHFNAECPPAGQAYDGLVRDFSGHLIDDNKFYAGVYKLLYRTRAHNLLESFTQRAPRALQQQGLYNVHRALEAECDAEAAETRRNIRQRMKNGFSMPAEVGPAHAGGLQRTERLPVMGENSRTIDSTSGPASGRQQQQAEEGAPSGSGLGVAKGDGGEAEADDKVETAGDNISAKPTATPGAFHTATEAMLNYRTPAGCVEPPPSGLTPRATRSKTKAGKAAALSKRKAEEEAHQQKRPSKRKYVVAGPD